MPTDLQSWLIAALVSINAWQLKEMYRINREMGSIKAQVGRMVSDSESEKETRRRVNSAILRTLGMSNRDIAETTNTPNPPEII